MDGSVLEKNLFFKMLKLTFSSKLDWCSYMICISKSSSKKIGALIRLDSFYEFSFLSFLYISINLQYGNAWNTVVMSSLVLLVAS